MPKFTANNWICYGGKWYKRGDIIDVPDKDVWTIEQMATLIDQTPATATEFVSEVFPPEKPKKKPGRPKKTTAVK